MALLDGDRFEGKFRDGVHVADASDLMRRLVKEQLLKFDGTPLFPERRAYTVNYKLSDAEAELYEEVTDYVREEFNRADALENEGRKGTVGFALTILQRRLASSPEAIYQSLRRRRERLEKRLARGAAAEARRRGPARPDAGPARADRRGPRRPGGRARRRGRGDRGAGRRSGVGRPDDRRAARPRSRSSRRLEAAGPAASATAAPTASGTSCRELLQNNGEMFDAHGHRRKLVIFTEHRDTLNYLAERIRGLLGRPEAVVTIHGGMGREERRKAQERVHPGQGRSRSWSPPTRPARASTSSAPT